MNKIKELKKIIDNGLYKNETKWEMIQKHDYRQAFDNFIRLMIYYLYHLLNDDKPVIAIIKTKEEETETTQITSTKGAVKDLENKKLAGTQ